MKSKKKNNDLNIDFSQHGGFKYGTKSDGSNYTSIEAFQYFVSNLESARILTNSSISCITLLLTLKRDTLYPPYIHLRRELLGNYMYTILLKISLRQNNPDMRDPQYIKIPKLEDTFGPPDKRRNIIEINTSANILNEVNLQNEIYKTSFSSLINYIDPFVPAILGHIKYAEYNNYIGHIYNYISPVFTDSRQGNENDINRVYLFIDHGIRAGHGISIIIMEFMDGYDTLENISNNMVMDLSSYQNTLFKYQSYILYELTKLLDYGIVHCDIHSGNCLINPNALYFTHDRGSLYIGRAIIIDFGRTVRINNLYPDQPQPLSTISTYYNNRELIARGKNPNWNQGLPFMQNNIIVGEEQNFINIYNNLLNRNTFMSNNYKDYIRRNILRNGDHERQEQELLDALQHYSIVPPAEAQERQRQAAERERQAAERERQAAEEAAETIRKEEALRIIKEGQSAAAEARQRASAAEARQRTAAAEARQRTAEAEARQRTAAAEARQRTAEAEARQRASAAEARQRAATAETRQRAAEEAERIAKKIREKEEAERKIERERKIAEQDDSSCRYRKFFKQNKLTNDSSIKDYLRTKCKNKNLYKKISRELHPDKNPYPCDRLSSEYFKICGDAALSPPSSSSSGGSKKNKIKTSIKQNKLNTKYNKNSRKIRGGYDIDIDKNSYSPTFFQGKDDYKKDDYNKFQSKEQLYNKESLYNKEPLYNKESLYNKEPVYNKESLYNKEVLNELYKNDISAIKDFSTFKSDIINVMKRDIKDIEINIDDMKDIKKIDTEIKDKSFFNKITNLFGGKKLRKHNKKSKKYKKNLKKHKKTKFNKSKKMKR